MKTFLLVGFLACLSSAYADMLGINVELTRTNQGPTWQTLVSIQAGYLTNYNRVNVSVKAAADDLRNLRFDFDGKFAVIHSADSVPVEDLMPIFEAMSTNQIGLFYIQIGQGPPTGMDIWKHK
jgi:hypothetical protein